MPINQDINNLPYAPVAAPAQDTSWPGPAVRPLRPWPLLVEKCPRLWLAAGVLGICAILFAKTLLTYNVPARPGCDQNGYLCTARLIVEKCQLSYVPRSDFQFVGRMMVKVPASGRVYAKYPFGYPLLAGIGRLFPSPWKPDGCMYLVNPLCTVAACVMSFFLFRLVVGNFAAMLGAIWLACNPVTLTYANDANSHASTLLCVVVGFWGLLRWWEMGDKGSWWRGFLGAFALGYACTIRYTEFMLVLPVAFIALARINFDLRRIRTALPALLGWAVPVTALAILCWIGYGRPWLTGYSLCREQTGFGLDYFIGSLGHPEQGIPPRQGNWETLLYQLNHIGLFLMLPIVIAGLFGLFWHSWKLGTAIVLWVVPSTVLYMFYYWAPAGERSVGYLRFFLTVFPGMILAALWLLEKALRKHRHDAFRHLKNRRRVWIWHRVIGVRRLPLALSLGAITALATSIDVANIIPNLAAIQSASISLRSLVDEVRRNYPPADNGNVIFADEACCEQLDNAGGYELYNLSLLRPGAFQGFKNQAEVPLEKQDDPNGLQRSRALEYMTLLGKKGADGQIMAKSSHEIDQQLGALVDDALKRNKRVAFVFHPGAWENMLENRKDLKLQRLATWSLPPALPPPAGGLLVRWREGTDRIKEIETQQEQRRNDVWNLYEVVKADGKGKAEK